ncbi:LysE family translocator [Serratia microhaemolytica]|uniref:LysE family translocator n=1 Tax=Serratia microhaemolytica TaxID=2675110 RepID=UPI000FDE0427|nr:LysE family translocator [Serratia microhaemolytica]
MNLTLLGGYILSVVVLLLTPGPVVALITGTAARHGHRKAFATAIGTNGASLVLIALATLMLTGVVSLASIWLNLTAIVGSCYIGYIALQSLYAVWGQTKTVTTVEMVPSESGSFFIKGFITGISNPKDILFFVSFFPQFISITDQFSTSIMVLFLLWMVIDLGILSIYILTIKRWMPSRHSRTMELLSALFLLLVALLGVTYNLREII